MNVSAWANATLSLSRGSIGQNSTGGTTRTATKLLDNIEACVQPAKGATIFDYSRRGLQIDSTIYVDSVDFRKNTKVPGDLMENDVFTDQDGINYVVVGFQRLYQPQLDDMPLYQIHVKTTT
jgi:hypothetical protein